MTEQSSKWRVTSEGRLLHETGTSLVLPFGWTPVDAEPSLAMAGPQEGGGRPSIVLVWEQPSKLTSARDFFLGQLGSLRLQLRGFTPTDGRDATFGPHCGYLAEHALSEDWVAPPRLAYARQRLLLNVPFHAPQSETYARWNQQLVFIKLLDETAFLFIYTHDRARFSAVRPLVYRVLETMDLRQPGSRGGSMPVEAQPDPRSEVQRLLADGRRAYYGRRFDEAASAFAQVVTLDPSCGEALEGIYWSASAGDAAAPVLSAAQRLLPDDLRLQGIAELADRRPEHAARLFIEALNEGADDPARYLLARAMDELRNGHQVASALNLLRDGEYAPYANIARLIERGRTHLAASDYGLAEEAFVEARKVAIGAVEPLEEESHDELISLLVLYRTKRWFGHAERLLRLFDTFGWGEGDVLLCLERAWLHFDRLEHEPAIQGFERVIDLVWFIQTGVWRCLTDPARSVVALAQEEARLLNHYHIDTEHLLLGLIREGKSVAAKTLESMNISLEAVRQTVRDIVGQGQTALAGPILFAPRAREVMELSLRGPRQLGDDHIGAEDVLLGLIQEGQGVASQVLQKLGADLNRVRQQVTKLARESKLDQVVGSEKEIERDATANQIGSARADSDTGDERIGVQGREDESADGSAATATLPPADPIACICIAQGARGRFSELDRYIESELARVPRDPVFLTERAILDYNLATQNGGRYATSDESQGRLREARNGLTRLEMPPARAVRAMAAVLAAQGRANRRNPEHDLRQAEDWCRREGLSAKIPGEATSRALVGLGDDLADSRDYDAARYCYQRGIAVLSNVEDAELKTTDVQRIRGATSIAWTAYALALAGQHRFDEAADSCDEAAAIVDRLPDSQTQALSDDVQKVLVTRAYARHNQGLFLARFGAFELAANAWGKAKAGYEDCIAPLDGPVYLHYGRLLHAVFGRLDDAKAQLKEGLGHDPQNTDLLLQMSELEVELADTLLSETRQGREKTGSQASQPSLEERTRAAERARMDAHTHTLQAVSVLENRLDDSPRDAEAHEALGVAYLALRRREQSQFHLQKASRLDREDASKTAAVGVFFLGSAEYLKAADWLERAHKQDESDLAIHANLAEAYRRLGRNEAAAAAYREILAVAPRHVEARVGLGEALVTFGDEGDTDAYAKAIEHFTKALTAATVGRGSKRLTPKEEAAVRYSRALARVRHFENGPAGRTDARLLRAANGDFKACERLDPSLESARRAIERLKPLVAPLGRTDRIERLGGYLVALGGLALFILVQILFFHGKLSKEVGAYVSLSLGALVVLMAGFVLPQLTKLSAPGVSLEKRPVEQATISRDTGIIR